MTNGAHLTEPALHSVNTPNTDKPLVRATDLARTFDVSAPWLNRVLERKPRQLLRAVDGVSFDIARGTTLALVGESGCGKSTVARLLVGLYAPTRGQFEFDGQDAHAVFKTPQGHHLRRRIQMIFQDPYASLNPRWTVEHIVGEPLTEHGIVSDPAELKAKVGELLKSVGLAPLDMLKYPHQFSGGQRQRISIARALATEPEFLVCDEPTSALDVSVQAQVLNIMKDLQKRAGPDIFVHQPQPGRGAPCERHGGRDVPRPPGGVGPQAHAVRQPTPPLHTHVARRHSRYAPNGPLAYTGARRGAQPAEPANGLCIQPALPARERPLPNRTPCADGVEGHTDCLPRGARGPYLTTR
jgi:ABC-type dipeptide/oligopeptide/nickel transport system ATPase subunit